MLADLDKDEKSASTEQQEPLIIEEKDDSEPAPVKPNPFAKLMMAAAVKDTNKDTTLLEPPKVGLGLGMWGNLVKKVQKK